MTSPSTKHLLCPALCGLLLLAAPLPASAAPRGGRVPGQPALEPSPALSEPDARDAGATGAARTEAAPGQAPAVTEAPVRSAPAAEPSAPRAAALSAPAASAKEERAQHSFGVAVGGLFPFANDAATAPRLALQVAGPMTLSALASRGARLEWLATAALTYTGRTIVGFTGTSELSTLGSELMPGLRVLYPVHPRLDVSLELSAGLGIAHASASSRTSAGTERSGETDWGGVMRIALGGQLPLDERLRLYIEPVAVQTYVASDAHTAWSAQFGLAYAF